jgi:hypothetical protein
MLNVRAHRQRRSTVRSYAVARSLVILQCCYSAAWLRALVCRARQLLNDASLAAPLR